MTPEPSTPSAKDTNSPVCNDSEKDANKLSMTEPSTPSAENSYTQRRLKEFDEKFKSHHFGVLKDGAYYKPEYFPLTIGNVKDFLSDSIHQAEQNIRQKLAEEIDDIGYSSETEGCGLEDLGITDRYEAMAYGWERHGKAVIELLSLLNP